MQRFLIASVPLLLMVAYSAFLDGCSGLDTTDGCFFATMPIACGLLSVIFGERFLAMLADLMSYFG